MYILDLARLTHWGWDKIASIFLTTFSIAFINENVSISVKFWLKFVPNVRINNILSLVQTMAWRTPGNKPLPERMIASLLTHIWCRHHMQIISLLLALCISGGFRSQRYTYFLSFLWCTPEHTFGKLCSCWWFNRPWRLCDVTVMHCASKLPWATSLADNKNVKYLYHKLLWGYRIVADNVQHTYVSLWRLCFILFFTIS